MPRGNEQEDFLGWGPVGDGTSRSYYQSEEGWGVGENTGDRIAAPAKIYTYEDYNNGVVPLYGEEDYAHSSNDRFDLGVVDSTPVYKSTTPLPSTEDPVALYLKGCKPPVAQHDMDTGEEQDNLPVEIGRSRYKRDSGDERYGWGESLVRRHPGLEGTVIDLYSSYRGKEHSSKKKELIDNSNKELSAPRIEAVAYYLRIIGKIKTEDVRKIRNSQYEKRVILG